MIRIDRWIALAACGVSCTSDAGMREEAQARAVPAREGLADPSFESYRAHVAAAAWALEAGDVSSARSWLDGAPAEHRGWEWRYLEGRADGSAAVLPEPGGALTALAWSPDGSLLALGAEDGSVLLKRPARRPPGNPHEDDATTELVRRIDAHAREVHAVEFSPDGALLATSGGDAKVRLWDVASGEERLCFENHTYPVSSVRFSPDGALAASVSYERPTGGELRVWSTADGSELRRFQAGYAPMTCVAWGRDKTVHTGSWAGLYATWSLEGDAQGRVIEVGSEDEYRAVNALALSPDGSLAALGGKDDEVHLFDTTDGSKRADLRGHDRAVWGLAFAPTGDLLASSDQKGAICVWDPADGSLLARLLGHETLTRGLAFSPEGELLASASADGTTRLWDVASLRARDDGGVFGDPAETFVYHATESPGGDRTAVAFHDGRVLLLEKPGGPELGTLKHEGWVNWVDFAPDGRRLLAAGKAGIAVWDTSSGERLLAIDATQDVECAVFAPDGERIASASRDRTARVFDARTGAELVEIPHGAIVREVSFSTDGKRIATAAYQDDTVRVFAADSGEPELELVHPSWVDGAAFGPLGRHLATAGDDGTLRLWSASSGELLREARGHDGTIQSLDFHPDGTRLATGGSDTRVSLWDVARLRKVLDVEDRDPIYALRFSTDGERLLAVPLSNRFRVLHARPLRERLETSRAGRFPWSTQSPRQAGDR